MKVLLIGEYSSLHKYLKEGLEELGHKVTLIANGDAWKKIGGADSYLFKSTRNPLLIPFNYWIDPYRRLKDLSGFDVVQIINPMPIMPPINHSMIKRWVNQNSLLSLICAGYDTRLIEAYESGFFEYYMLDGADSELALYSKRNPIGLYRRWNDRRVEVLADTIIPCLYEYQVGYPDNIKRHSVIPFPVNLEQIQYSENKPENKVVIFHGLNRETEKGTSYIRKALERIEREFPDEVEIIIKGHMPFSEYLTVLNRTNIVVDQCKSLGYGMNACIAMGQGKVVLSGASPDTVAALHLKPEECPVINIEPDENQIYEQVKKLLEHKEKLPELGLKSREYVEKVHDCKTVASQYVSAWNEAARRKREK